MAQIDVDNVLQVKRLFDERVDAARRTLAGSAALRAMPPCADDPVSKDAVVVFQPKVDALRKTHSDYVNELIEARNRLVKAVEEYGLTEDENAASFSGSSGLQYRGPHVTR
ncbi:hypothetical protein [Pseudonocardia alni]|uniref:hypothetical protein n=1 Tax=Pseudonocardia alni TaxID=33907 RepID=UPI001AD7C5C7|nr:hypothetical protein [Pseudonocardia alni]MBO4238749.1 hypothetical protein [Pseudonocardia alni]